MITCDIQTAPKHNTAAPPGVAIAVPESHAGGPAHIVALAGSPGVRDLDPIDIIEALFLPVCH